MRLGKTIELSWIGQASQNAEEHPHPQGHMHAPETEGQDPHPDEPCFAFEAGPEVDAYSHQYCQCQENPLEHTQRCKRRIGPHSLSLGVEVILCSESVVERDQRVSSEACHVYQLRGWMAVQSGVEV